MVPNYDHLYLDKNELYQRGWTENLISRFLGSPDKIKFVRHFLNWQYPSEKRCYYLSRVETIEKDPLFDDAFKEQRKIDETNIQSYLAERKKKEGLVDKYIEVLNDEGKEEFYRNQQDDQKAVEYR